MATATIALLGTCDTKLDELLFLRQRILDMGAKNVILVDVGRKPVDHSEITISQYLVTHFVEETVNLMELPRGEVIKHMIKCATPCVRQLYEERRMNGIVSVGGSGGTSLSATVMRQALPIGFPKLIVSTIAGGDLSSLVGEADITMMYSVVDIAGSNTLLKDIFSNAAGAIVGMAKAYRMFSSVREKTTTTKKRVGVTMFGVTTPAVDVARRVLEDKYDCEVFVFHATGRGGRAMERLLEEGGLDAALDMTTTEIADELAGGNMSAGPNRLEIPAKLGIPYIVSCGATSMVNFGPRATVPPHYDKRLLFEHNPTVTLMRTSAPECRQIGEFIVEKLKTHTQNPELVQVVLPTGGVCMISTPGAAFADADADKALFDTITSGLSGSEIVVVEDERAINEEGFARDIAERLATLMQLESVESLAKE